MAKETELGSDPPRILSLDDYFECDGEVKGIVCQNIKIAPCPLIWLFVILSFAIYIV